MQHRPAPHGRDIHDPERKPDWRCAACGLPLSGPLDPKAFEECDQLDLLGGAA